jgi:hypothetical protein
MSKTAIYKISKLAVLLIERDPPIEYLTSVAKLAAVFAGWHFLSGRLSLLFPVGVILLCRNKGKTINRIFTGSRVGLLGMLGTL